ncbi:MAG: hypothetical protein WC421_05280 [Elusimicrobiales bacterium]
MEKLTACFLAGMMICGSAFAGLESDKAGSGLKFRESAGNSRFSSRSGDGSGGVYMGGGSSSRSKSARRFSAAAIARSRTGSKKMAMAVPALKSASSESNGKRKFSLSSLNPIGKAHAADSSGVAGASNEAASRNKSIIGKATRVMDKAMDKLTEMGRKHPKTMIAAGLALSAVGVVGAGVAGYVAAAGALGLSFPTGSAVSGAMLASVPSLIAGGPMLAAGVEGRNFSKPWGAEGLPRIYGRN